METGPEQEPPSRRLDTSAPMFHSPVLLRLRMGHGRARLSSCSDFPPKSSASSSAGTSEASPAAGVPACSLGLPWRRGRRGAKPSSWWVLSVPSTNNPCVGTSVIGPEERPGRSKRAFQSSLRSPACFFTSKPFHQSTSGAWQGRPQYLTGKLAHALRKTPGPSRRRRSRLATLHLRTGLWASPSRPPRLSSSFSESCRSTLHS